jgi:hypothetical protein
MDPPHTARTEWADAEEMEERHRLRMGELPQSGAVENGRLSLPASASTCGSKAINLYGKEEASELQQNHLQAVSPVLPGMLAAPGVPGVPERPGFSGLPSLPDAPVGSLVAAEPMGAAALAAGSALGALLAAANAPQQQHLPQEPPVSSSRPPSHSFYALGPPQHSFFARGTDSDTYQPPLPDEPYEPEAPPLPPDEPFDEEVLPPLPTESTDKPTADVALSGFDNDSPSAYISAPEQLTTPYDAAHGPDATLHALAQGACAWEGRHAQANTASCTNYPSPRTHHPCAATPEVSRGAAAASPDPGILGHSVEVLGLAHSEPPGAPPFDHHTAANVPAPQFYTSPDGPTAASYSSPLRRPTSAHPLFQPVGDSPPKAAILSPPVQQGLQPLQGISHALPPFHAPAELPQHALPQPPYSAVPHPSWQGHSLPSQHLQQDPVQQQQHLQALEQQGLVSNHGQSGLCEHVGSGMTPMGGGEQIPGIYSHGEGQMPMPCGRGMPWLPMPWQQQQQQQQHHLMFEQHKIHAHHSPVGKGMPLGPSQQVWPQMQQQQQLLLQQQDPQVVLPWQQLEQGPPYMYALGEQQSKHGRQHMG